MDDFDNTFGHLSDFNVLDSSIQGRIKLEVEGGAICRVGAKHIVTSKRAKGAQKILGHYSGKILWFFN